MASLPSLKTDTHGVIPYSGARRDDLTLFDIQDGLVAVIAAHEEALELAASIDRLPGTPEELAELRADANRQVEQTEAAVMAYLREEVKKVDSIAGYVRYCEAMAETASRELARVKVRADAWERRVDRVKAMTLGIMQHFGVPRFETSLNVIRRQKNGGLVAPEIFEPIKVPDRFLRVTVQMSVETFKSIDEGVRGQMLVKDREFLNTPIRQALERGEDVPGARLGERAEHLRVE